MSKDLVFGSKIVEVVLVIELAFEVLCRNFSWYDSEKISGELTFTTT